ncbi:MAG: hypothetical protein ABW217_18130, partial [Polyangiaceae bacterium]
IGGAGNSKYVAASTLALALLVACGDTDPALDDLALGRRLVDDVAFRRAALEDSVAADDGDARLRLAHYGVAGEWEDLPLLDVETAPVIDGEEPSFERVWSGDVEWSRDALLALGRRAFEEWPAQRAPSLAPLLAASGAGSRLDDIGTWGDARGRVGGFVWVRYADGTTEPGLSCASCHARPDANGELVHGAASAFDLGALTQQAWGAGRVDVTTDDRDNAAAMPDLRATRHQRRLHHAGNLYNGLAALAVRTETLLVTARAEAVRPPRELAFALAYYVWSLGGDEPTPARRSRVFHDYCERCHFDATGAGDIVSSLVVGTDPAVADSSARGSGGYRVPSLYRISERSQLTHEGWPLTLEQFLEPSRAAEYPGHEYGFELDASERALLVRELSGR